MKLADLPDISFVNMDEEEIEAKIFAIYYRITGRTLAKADPIRLFLLFVVNLVIMLLNKTDEVGKQNLLKYATCDNLDVIAASYWHTERIAAQPALTTLKATLSTVRTQETIIPAGTRVSPRNGIYFATNEDLIIPAGEIEGTVTATCTETGEIGNDYAIGEIKQIVDPVAYVMSMVNITKSNSGADVEDDESFRERTYESPESFSTAGPQKAYEWHVKSMNSSIVDVGVSSPSECVINIVPLLKNGEIPGQELLDYIKNQFETKPIVPMTDHIYVNAPESVSYEINVQYYIDEDADAALTQNRVKTAVDEYVLWQKSKLGRDINDSELHSSIKQVSGVKRVKVLSPEFTKIEKTQLAIADTDSINVVMIGREEE